LRSAASASSRETPDAAMPTAHPLRASTNNEKRSVIPLSDEPLHEQR
jgi:hypothetical protein